MSKFKVLGVIDLPQSTTVLVCDIDKLADLAEEDGDSF
jgi:hypothetical protein